MWLASLFTRLTASLSGVLIGEESISRLHHILDPSVPCGCKTEVPISFLSPADDYSQLLEASHIPGHVTCSGFKASNGMPPVFESTSPERAKSLSRAHLVRSRPPKIVPLCERQLCQIKYLSTQVIHKAQGLYTGGRNLGHTSSARHVFSVSSPQDFSLLVESYMLFF